MPESPTVQEVQLAENTEAVIALWRRNLPGAARGDAGAKLQAGYLDNPAGVGRCLMLYAAPAGMPVGVICLHPRRFHLGTREVAANNLADFAVDTAYRTLGPALMLMRSAVALVDANTGLLYGLPNRKSAAVCKRAGLRTLGEFERYASVISGRHPRVAQLSGILHPVASPAVTLALVAMSALRALWLRPKVRCEHAGFDDPAVDALWARRPSQLLLGDRSSAMLRWRYGQSGRGEWKLCLVRDSKDLVIGLLVWRLREGQAEVGDFFSADPGRDTAAMLNGFCRFARKLGAHGVSLEFFGAPEVLRGLDRAGFRARNESVPVFFGALPAALAEAHDQQHWYLTSFDNDAN